MGWGCLALEFNGGISNRATQGRADGGFHFLGPLEKDPFARNRGKRSAELNT